MTMISETGFWFLRDSRLPDPSPRLGAAIARLHRWCVGAAVRRLETTDVGRLSAATYLHPLCVERALAALGIAPGRTTDPGAAFRDRTARVAAYLRAHGPSSGKDIGAALGLPPSTLAELLRTQPGTFRVAGRRKPRWGKSVTLWGLT